MTSDDERTCDELVSLTAAFLEDMLKTTCLVEVEIMDAFEGAIREYRKVKEAQREQAASAERWMQGLKKKFTEVE